MDTGDVGTIPSHVKDACMKKTIFAIPFLPAALLAAAAGAQSGSGDDIRARLEAAGYTEVREIEFDSGLWEAEVRRADGRRGEVALDPASGEIFDSADGRASLDAAAIAAALESAGYTAITDLDRDGALWDAEAVDAAGQRVELRASGHDGRVLHVEAEHDD
jgi:hypothetical protein